MQILDNHFHIRSSGRNVEAAKDFQRAGGTHVVVAHLPHSEHRIESDRDHRTGFELTLSLAERVRRETELKVFATVGPYPVELVRLAEKMSLEESIGVMMKGMETAASVVEEGRAIAIGEIGRPHFPVGQDVLKASNKVLAYGMKLASEVGCPVVLHTESATPETFRELAGMADAAGLDRSKVIKHFSPPIVDVERNSGLFPSIVSSRRNITEAISQGNRFLMETDYLDDLRRPGAVLGPATVPKRTLAFLQDGVFTEEDVHKIHEDNPRRVYGDRFG